MPFLTNPGQANLPPIVFLLIGIWTVLWKGLALWKSAQERQKYWFVALLVINTLGILDIIYLLFFSGDREYLLKLVRGANKASKNRGKRK